MADSITNVVSVTIVTRHDSRYGAHSTDGIITGGDPMGVWVQSPNCLPQRYDFTEIVSLTVHT